MYYKLKLTIRNARKNGVLTFAKLFGLSLSFAVILFAVGYVYYETSFDKCVPDHDKIYRCLMQGRLNGQEADFAVTSPAMAKAITDDIPEITEAVRILSRGDAVVNFNHESHKGGQLYLTDPNFFSFFSIPIKTNLSNPLAGNNDLVIAKSVAENIFGSAEDALGKTVEVRGENCVITGVFDDVPKNFHLQLTLVQSLQKSNPDDVGWGSQSYYTYFKTNKSDINIDDLNFKICKTVYTHYDDRIDGAKAKSMKDLKFSPDVYLLYTAERLTDIHFSVHKFDPAVTSTKTYVYGAIILAILILLISSINFINLTIANISTRLKEVGIRKVAGASNKSIIYQFLFESFIFWLVGFVLAVIIYQLTGNMLGRYLGFEIALTSSAMRIIIVSSFAVLLLLNLAANIFPIILISSRKTLSLVKAEKPVNKSFTGNNFFVLFQFVLSGLIILGSIIVQKQINYMANKDRGYNSENIIMLTMWEMNPQTRKSLLDELKTYNEIKSVSTSDVYFGTDFSMNTAYFESNRDENYFHTSVLPVDDAFMKTFNFEMKEGRFFEKEKQTDFNAVVLNETAVKLYPGEGSIIGKNVLVDGKTLTVIGVAKDFNFRSLHYQIQPLVIMRIENLGNVYIKTETGQIPKVIGILKEKWAKFNISVPFEYTFHDQVLAKHYSQDQNAKRLLLILSIISIAIACVGLYAISFFTIVKRTKEIGIRKAAGGAMISEILALLNRDIVKWVAIAYVIANPLALYLTSKWQQNFAYKTEISWWIFVLAGLITLGIALITVSWLSWKAARKNPVEAIRYE